jgi:hypothetical protein
MVAAGGEQADYGAEKEAIKIYQPQEKKSER